MKDITSIIESGKTVLGIEFGSTRIKAVLIREDHEPIASGSFDWENQYVNHIWTYDLQDVIKGLQESYKNMAQEVLKQFGVVIRKIGVIGISGMMHGYLVFDEQDKLLAPFRTWRNTITEEASEQLTKEFVYHIPQRFSIAHLYQAILKREDHISKIRFQTTLAGYIHFKLTGEKVLGIGEASGMFPIDLEAKTFAGEMLDKFDRLVEDREYPWNIREILPKVLTAGEHAGVLTGEGAKLLDISGNLESGILFCPPEGDVGKAGQVKDPKEASVKSFELFMERYTQGLGIERAAIDYLS